MRIVKVAIRFYNQTRNFPKHKRRCSDTNRFRGTNQSLIVLILTVIFCTACSGYRIIASVFDNITWVSITNSEYVH